MWPSLDLLQNIDYKKLYFPANVTLYDSTQIMDSNPIKTAIVVCNKLIKEQVDHDDDNDDDDDDDDDGYDNTGD